MLAAIDNLPEDEREVFGLVRFQGLTQAEAAEVLGVSTKTVQRRLNRASLLLSRRTRRPATASRAGDDAGRVTGAWPVVLSRSIRLSAAGDGRWTVNRAFDLLLEELLDSEQTPEEVCRDCPELLPQVRKAMAAKTRLRRPVGCDVPGSGARLASGDRRRAVLGRTAPDPGA